MYGNVDRQAGGLQEVGDQVPLDDLRVDRPHLVDGGGDGGAAGGERGGGARDGRGSWLGRARVQPGGGEEQGAEEELEHVSSEILTFARWVFTRRSQDGNCWRAAVEIVAAVLTLGTHVTGPEIDPYMEFYMFLHLRCSAAREES